MSTHTDTLRQVRRGTATTRGRAITMSPSKPSSMTQSFFARGEEQEATGYENLAPDDPLLVPREVEFDSFDEIPRRRGSLFAIAVSVLVLIAIGFVTWRSFYYLSKPGSSVAAASRAMVQTPPASPAPAPMSIAPASQPAQTMSEAPPATEQAPAATNPAPEPATQPTRVAQPAGVAQPAPVSQPAPVAQPAPAAQPSPAAQAAPAAQPAPAAEAAPAAQPSPAAQPAPAAQAAPAPQPSPAAPSPSQRRAAKRATVEEPVHGRHAALRGYVWSPEKHTLVPAEPAAGDAPPRHAPMRGYTWSPDKHTLVPAEPAVEDPLPSKDPGTHSLDGTPGEEPQPQRPSTSPAPFQPSPSSSSPPNASAPIIE